jgi:hypothetical protein
MANFLMMTRGFLKIGRCPQFPEIYGISELGNAFVGDELSTRDWKTQGN